uniref:Uncharacterized protein n=1 Tax=Rhipicephalus zambeziensis TaxID=60191 RepID=A0A224YG05_9ACAR
MLQGTRYRVHTSSISCILINFEDLFSKDFPKLLTCMPAKCNISDSDITKFLRMISFTSTCIFCTPFMCRGFKVFVLACIICYTNLFLFILAHLCIISPLER